MLFLFAALVVLGLICNPTHSYFVQLGRNTPQNPKTCYFSGAGIYFWWQIGCAKYMKENCDLTKFPSFVGASAGSLTATLLATNTDLNSITSSAIDLSRKYDVYSRKTGLAGIWGGLLRLWLEEIIPNEDSFDKDMISKLYIAVTPTFKKSKLVTDFIDREDLINACLASCHVPLFLDGRPSTEFRGEQVIDGSFWYFVTKERTSGLTIPENIQPEKVFWVDYVDDEQFLESVSGNFLELSSPDGLVDMMDAGYNFMKREHYNSRLPFTKYEKPNFVSYSNIINSMNQIPIELKKKMPNVDIRSVMPFQ
eukprot:gene3971-5691_t